MIYLAFVPARKPPVAVLLHHQGYQHQAISTANTTNPTEPPNLPPTHSHLPVQNVHVQNIQAQNIQVQNVLVQPTVALEQNIQGHNVQLQTVQSGGYLPTSAPYSNVQIQNIGPQVQQSKVEEVKVKTEITPEKNEESVKPEGISFLAPVSTFQIVTSVVTTASFTSTVSNHNYIMTYSNLPAKTSENQTSVIIGPDLVGTGTVLVSQPMLMNIEPTPNQTTQFGGYVPVIYSTSVCCPTQKSNSPEKDSTDAKQARTPLVPTQNTHSPQLPVPSPNYPIQSQMIPETTDKLNESRNIPNRNVPILNNNYINSGNSHHSDITSQARIGDKVDCLKSNGEKVNSDGNSGVVYSDSINNNNELFNQVANLNNVNNDDSSRHANDKMLCTQTFAQHECIDSGPQNTLCKDYESLISTNQIVNITPCVEPDKAPTFTVLNVPTLSRFKVTPEVQPVSRLDLMTARRRERRLKRIRTRSLKPNAKPSLEDTDSSVYTSSESDSEEGFKVDLWIRSGPPLKPDYKREKLKFLKIFGLTTHYDRNGNDIFKAHLIIKYCYLLFINKLSFFSFI